ncbi:hypothetical protein PIB30_058867 [Stylosanthes scabra]|uniref:Uncharacterized protein n=1 Tax=Stylosanthes scabra TaxID=79078 RepID=A0ABU6TJT3_9FABA|nr:hypothetical protein [Stylosanthes scabra]
MIFNTPVDTEDNRKLFKRAFLLYVQKCFLLPTSAPNVTPRALPTLFNLENTRNRNWTLHVHNFLLEEVAKAKKKNTKSVSGCYYAMSIIYFHETHFGKNILDPLAQHLWIQYWKGNTLWKRMKQEKKMQHYESESGSNDTFSENESESEEIGSENMVQVERIRKRGNDSGSARDKGSSETLPLAQKIVSEIQDRHRLAQAVLSIRKIKHQEIEDRSKKRTKHPIEDPPIGSDTVSLGNDGSNAESATSARKEPPYQQPPPQHQPPPQEEDNNPTHIEEATSQLVFGAVSIYPTKQVIDISSSSEDEPEPTPITVLIPKTEGDIIEEHPPRLERQDEEAPSQSVVEVVPIYPTQEVIDISSSSEDEHEPQSIKVVVPKIKDCLVTSPSSKLITDVLMSMGQELQSETQPDPSVPYFSLGKEFQRPLRTQE